MRLKASTLSMIMMPGNEHEVRGGEDLVALGGQHRAPLGRRRLHAEAEEADSAAISSTAVAMPSVACTTSGVRVFGQHAVLQDAPRANAEGAVGGHEVLLADR